MSTRVAYSIVLTVVAATTCALTPLFRHLAVRWGAVVAPDERRVHTTPTPLLGGVAMLIGFLAGMLVAWRLDVLASIFSGTTEPIGVVIAAVAILVLGTVDDVREVSAPAKLAGTVVCASILVYFGISMLVFRVPFAGVVVLSPDWSFLLSVLWVLGMTHAINLIDGLDGLAAGIVAIAAATFFAYTLRLGDAGLLAPGNVGPLIALVVLGMCIGFLPWNVHPAKIFMGDGGALLLGLLMAAATMVVGGRTDQQFSGQTYFFFAPLFIPLFILGVPIVDTAFAIVRRATRRSGVATADKEHIHHRLMRLGHGHRRSVFILWAWTALLSVMVLYPAYTGRGDGLVPLGVLALGLLLYTVLHPGVRSSRAERRDAAEAGAGEEPAEEEATGEDPAAVLAALDAETAALGAVVRRGAGADVVGGENGSREVADRDLQPRDPRA